MWENDYARSFKPIAADNTIEINKILVQLRDSPYRIIPTNALPTVPIPVQIAYAVPIGIVSIAIVRKIKLKTNPIHSKRLLIRFLC
ncbi:hypothetical protein D3C81_2112630 [compost metagenome]